MESSQDGEGYLDEFLSDTSKFSQIAAEFSDEVACYRQLRSSAKSSLTSFDEYIQFYAACIDEGPTGFVYHDLQKNAIRSLKNMVLRDSDAGKRFPIQSARELNRRIKAYQDLGVDTVTERAVVFTLIEHILDHDTHKRHGYEIIALLLDDLPDKPTKTVEILIRAGFIFSVQSSALGTEGFDKYVDSFFSKFPAVRPDDDRTAAELLEDAEKRSYADPEKLELVTASLSRQQDVDTLQEYLYLSARDVVERYRHQSLDDPWRGEFQLAVKQYYCLLNRFDTSLTDERKARIRSYRSVALGELESGGRWRSQRDPDNLPDANFFNAVKHYLQAAQAIQLTDENRYIKYLSKAFRHQATATHHKNIGPANGWVASQQLHRKAAEVLMLVANESEETEVRDTAIGSIAYHNFQAHQAAAAIAFEQRNPERILDHADEAWSHIDDVRQYVKTDLLKDLQQLADVVRKENSGEFEAALDGYEEAEHPKLDLEKRQFLVEIKAKITHQDYESALEIAEEEFEENSPILTAVQLTADTGVTSPSLYPPIYEGLSCIETEAGWLLATFTHLVSQIDTTVPVIAEDIEQLLLKI